MKRILFAALMIALYHTLVVSTCVYIQDHTHDWADRHWFGWTVLYTGVVIGMASLWIQWEDKVMKRLDHYFFVQYRGLKSQKKFKFKGQR